MSWSSLFFSYHGRINRVQYWIAMAIFTVLVGMLVGGFLAVANSLLPHEAASPPGTRGIAEIKHQDWPGILAVCLATLVVAAVVYVGLAIQTKRWHDRGKSGWWMLINFLPAIGSTWTLVECGFIEGTQGPNRYGLPPQLGKAVQDGAESG